jgi:hypothetical protein
MPILLQLAQSYSNPDSVNYKIAYLREQLKNDLGKLAYEDQVQVAMLGETIIVGGYLRTELIAANSIVGDKIAANSIVGDKIDSNAIVTRHIQANAITSDKIAANAITAVKIDAGAITTDKIAAGAITADKIKVDDLAAITAKFSGNVYVGGDLLVGGQGVLSVLKFESSGLGAFGDTNGWSDMGIISGTTNYRGRVALFVSIPSNFVITKATLYLYAMPVYYENLNYPSNGFPTKWKQSRNLKLYYSDGEEGYWLYGESSGLSQINWRSGTDITNAVFGSATWSPTLAYSGDNESNTENKIQLKSGDIKSYLIPGENRAFFVQTTDSATDTNFQNNQGLGKMIVLVEGYASVSK